MNRTHLLVVPVLALLLTACGSDDKSNKEIITDKPTLDMTGGNTPDANNPGIFDNTGDIPQVANTNGGFNQGTIGTSDKPLIIQGSAGATLPAQMGLGQSIPFSVRSNQQGNVNSNYMVVCRLLVENSGQLVPVMSKECGSSSNGYAYSITQNDLGNANLQNLANAQLIGAISVVAANPNEQDSLIELADSVTWKTSIGGLSNNNSTLGNANQNQFGVNQNQLGNTNQQGRIPSHFNNQGVNQGIYQNGQQSGFLPQNPNNPNSGFRNPNTGFRNPNTGGLQGYNQGRRPNSGFPAGYGVGQNYQGQNFQGQSQFLGGALDSGFQSLGINPQIGGAILTQLIQGALSGRR